MPFDIYNKKFQNWLKGVFGLNTTRTALCECITDKLDNGLKRYSNEELHQYFVCLKANNISLLHTKSKGSTDKGWECEHTSCRDIMRYFIDNHKQGHKLKYTWAPLGKSESNGTVGCGNYCKELKWNVIKLYMHIENETVMKQCTSLDCLDITHVIKIMRNCKLISTNDLDKPLEEVLSSRNNFMHSPDNKMTAIETCNTIQCTRKLLDCLDIAEKDYYKNAAQELHDLSVNDFVLRYQSEECKRILADVLNARHLAVELNSNIKEDNLPAKSQSKRLQEKLENITGLRSTTNTNLEMKHAEYKRKSKECLEKKIDAIKLDQMECDKNSTEYTKLEDLKDWTEGALEEVIVITQRLESEEMVDEIEKLKNENETLKSEIKQNNTSKNTNLEMKLAEDKRKSNECLEKKIDGIKLDQIKCDKNSAEYTKLEELKDGIEGALEEEITTTNTNLEMKLAEDKRKSKEYLEKEIGAIKVDQMECDKNSAEYTKLEELKDGTEGVLEEEITTTNTNLEMKLAEDKRKSKECLEKKIDAIKTDQMECDKNSAEYTKLEELKDGTEGALEEETTTTNTNLEMKLAEDKRKSKECLEKKIDAIKVDQMECDKNSAEYTKLEELKDGTEGALEEEIVITQRLESEEMVDEIEKLWKEKETLKSEIKQNNAEKDVGSLILLEKKEDSIDLENASLLNEIVWLLDMDRDAEVIMLIGQSGAGKSAMLNTIHRVLTRQYYTLAKQGTGHAGSVTQSNERYNNCGVYLETVRDDSRREKIAAVVHKLPHIVDCPGMGDDDSPALSEILELLVGGFIPHGTHIGALQSNQKEFGVGCLKELLYINSNPADRVTKVVFIQSCRNAIPRNLINCLNEVLKIKDPTTMRRKYTAEVFLLISKFDLVHDPSVHISSGSDKDSMTIEDFIKMENELASEFNIVGVLEANRIIRWASYSDNIQGRNKYIENIALKFLRRMVQP